MFRLSRPKRRRAHPIQVTRRGLRRREDWITATAKWTRQLLLRPRHRTSPTNQAIGQGPARRVVADSRLAGSTGLYWPLHNLSWQPAAPLSSRLPRVAAARPSVLRPRRLLPRLMPHRAYHLLTQPKRDLPRSLTRLPSRTVSAGKTARARRQKAKEYEPCSACRAMGQECI